MPLAAFRDDHLSPASAGLFVGVDRARTGTTEPTYAKADEAASNGAQMSGVGSTCPGAAFIRFSDRSREPADVAFP
jgi:hypothetical protein